MKLELTTLGMDLIKDRVLQETMFYFIGVHFLRERRRRVAIWLIKVFRLHNHKSKVKHMIMRKVLDLFACEHSKWINRIGFSLLVLWLVQDLAVQAHLNAYVLDGTRIGVGFVALRMFNDWL